MRKGAPPALFYYRARYYDPSVGRFLSEDSLRFERGPNFYSYVGNNPTNWVDPIGHGCYLRTPTGFSEVPCANKCLGNVCHVAAPPLPPLPPSPAAKAYAEALLSLSVMSKCSGERAQEILDIWGEAINGSQNDIAKGRAEDVAVTAGEAAAEHAGLELTEEILSHGAFVLVGYEIYEQIHGYHEFKQRLEETKQHECECYDKAMEKYKKSTR